MRARNSSNIFVNARERGRFSQILDVFRFNYSLGRFLKSVDAIRSRFLPLQFTSAIVVYSEISNDLLNEDTSVSV